MLRGAGLAIGPDTGRGYPFPVKAGGCYGLYPEPISGEEPPLCRLVRT